MEVFLCWYTVLLLFFFKSIGLWADRKKNTVNEIVSRNGKTVKMSTRGYLVNISGSDLESFQWAW